LEKKREGFISPTEPNLKKGKISSIQKREKKEGRVICNENSKGLVPEKKLPLEEKRRKPRKKRRGQGTLFLLTEKRRKSRQNVAEKGQKKAEKSNPEKSLRSRRGGNQEGRTTYLGGGEKSILEG